MATKTTRSAAKKTARPSTSPKKSAPKAKATYHHGDLRRALLDAAKLELSAVGKDELSLRGVARRAGVSHAAPYHHFPDKDALLAHLAKDGFLAFGAALQAGADSVVDDAFADDLAIALARLYAVGRAYLVFARTDPSAFALIMGGCSQKHRDVFDAEGAAAYAVLARAVAAVRAAAGIDDDAAATNDDAMLHWGVVHGLAKLEAENGISSVVDVEALWGRVGARLGDLYARTSSASSLRAASGGIDAVGTRPR
jgi:AcrR family transcriptional regulator